MRISVISLAALVFTVALAGCSLTGTATPGKLPGMAIKGNIHGGQQPINGGHVYLLAAGAAGYGTSSISLLTTGIDGTDSIGGYVLTGPDGGFNLSGDYTCTANQQVYILSVGGDAGSGENSAAGLMAPVGSCPNSGTFVGTPLPFIVVNEISTIALAYSTAGFSTDPLHISNSGTALGNVGLANAFATSANLTNGTTIAGNGTVPSTTINTLADILASCINTAGPRSSSSTFNSCQTLFANTLQDSIAPTNTAAAAINIAHNPTNNISALFSLITSTAPFQPTMAAAPADFTLALSFTGGGLSTSSAEINQTANVLNNIAVDSAGNIWKPNYDTNTLTGLSPLGVPLASNGFSGGGLSQPANVTVDPSGNIWTANVGSDSVSAFDSTGTPLSGSPFGFGAISSPADLAADGNGNIWVLNASTLAKLDSSGQNTSGSPFVSNALSSPYGVAIQPGGNVWVTNSGSSSVAVYNANGRALSGSPYSGGFLSYPYGIAFDSAANGWIADEAAVTDLSQLGSNVGTSPFMSPSGTIPTSLAVDGNGNVWVTDVSNNAILELTPTGAYISGSLGFQSGQASVPEAIAIDGSGNVWYSSYNDNTVHEIIGAATPVVTPLALGLQQSTLGSRP